MYKTKYWIVFIGIWVIFCSYLFVFVYSTAKEKAISDLNARQEIHAGQARKGIELSFNHYLSLLEALAKNNSIIDFDQNGKNRLEEIFENHKEEIAGISRLDQNGILLYTVPLKSELIGSDISSQKHFVKIKKTLRPVLSDVFHAVQGYDTVAIHVPVFQNGRFGGSVAILIDFRKLAQRYLKDIRIGQTGYAWMISAEGIELYCPVPGHVGKSVFDNCCDFPTIIKMANDMLKGKKGTTTYLFDRIMDNKVETIKKHAVYLPIRIADSFWSIVVASTEDEILEGLEVFKNRLIILILVFLFGSVVLTFLSMKAWNIVREDEKRKIAEMALRENEEKYRLLADNTGDLVWTCDLDFNLTYVSPSVKKVKGFTAEEEMNRKMEQGYMTESAHLLLFTLTRMLKEKNEGSSFHEYLLDLEHCCKDGKTIWMESRISYLHDSDQKTVGFLGVNRDITERRRAEEELRESKEKIRATFNAISDSVFLHPMLDEGFGFFEEVNETACARYGYSREEFLELNASHVTISRDFKIHASRNHRQKLRREGRSIFETTHINRLGEEFPVEINAVVFEMRGRPMILSVVRDITERKLEEREKEKLLSQLQHAQKMEAVGVLAGGIAHDFNNLLQAINGYTQLLLLDKGENDLDFGNLCSIRKAAERAAQLVQQLLLFSRKVETEHRPVALNHEIDQARRILERTIPRMVKIDIQTQKDLWLIGADPIQVEQILLNLGANAADAMPEGGTLFITTENVTLDSLKDQASLDLHPGRYVLLSVQDTGEGMTQDTVEHIFEPFFTTKGIGKGTGLGLASVYGIVKNHEGNILCSSRIGQGTTFRIFFPAISSDRQVHETREEQASPKPGNETILLVDDEEAIRGVGEQVLRKYGYSVSTASSGEDALEIFKKKFQDIHLVIMDLGMPGMGGFRCLQALLQIDPAAKVLIASGYSIDGQVRKALEAGAVGYVSKPYCLSGLLEKIRLVLD